MKRFRTLTICAAATVLALGLAACNSSGGSTQQQADNNPPATSEPAASTSAATTPHLLQILRLPQIPRLLQSRQIRARRPAAMRDSISWTNAPTSTATSPYMR